MSQDSEVAHRLADEINGLYRLIHAKEKTLFEIRDRCVHSNTINVSSKKHVDPKKFCVDCGRCLVY
jgi:hypothetical protein